MKSFQRFCLAMFSVVLIASCGICANSKDNMTDPKITTIVGKIIDVSCYVSHANNDWKDKECVVNFLKVGQPAGILEEGSGKLYIVAKTEDYTVNLAAKLIPYAAEKVRVKGIVNTRAGVNTIDIREIEKVK